MSINYKKLKDYRDIEVFNR